MRAELNQGLIDFLKASPTPFHATASLARRLEAAGYRRLDERDAWHTETGGRYYVSTASPPTWYWTTSCRSTTPSPPRW